MKEKGEREEKQRVEKSSRDLRREDKGERKRRQREREREEEKNCKHI